jgi:hypothetical protein
VVPGEATNPFHVTLDFTPVDPSPKAIGIDPRDAARVELARQEGERRVQTGGNLVSPALDLIAVAGELGRLQELRARVESSGGEQAATLRAKLAFLALIDIELGDFAAAHRDLDALYPLVESCTEHTLPARSAELLAIHGAWRHPQTRGFARDAATNLYIRGVRVPSRGPAVAWESHLMAILAMIRHCDRNQAEVIDADQVAVSFSRSPGLNEWSAASHATAASRGAGHSRPRWQRLGERIENANSHGVDYLYYHIPLQGNFEVECDLQTRDYQNTQLVVGGQWAESLYYSLDKYEFGNLTSRLGRAAITPKLTKYREWMRMRAVVRGPVIAFHANGRLLHRVEVQG